MTLGGSIVIQSDLGSSAFDALNMGLSYTFGYSPGTWCIICGIVITTINGLLQKNTPNIYSLLTSIISGAFIDFWLNIIPMPYSNINKTFMFLIGILLNSFGIAYYTHTNIANGPIDQFMILIHEIFHQNYFISKILLESFLIVLSYIFHGTLGIGTIIIMLLSGYFINSFYSLLDKYGGN